MKRLVAFIALLLLPGSFQSLAADPNRILIVVGPTNHPPGTHEVAAGGRLMKHCLENVTNFPNLKADVVYEWPGKTLRDSASTLSGI